MVIGSEPEAWSWVEAGGWVAGEAVEGRGGGAEVGNGGEGDALVLKHLGYGALVHPRTATQFILELLEELPRIVVTIPWQSGGEDPDWLVAREWRTKTLVEPARQRERLWGRSRLRAGWARLRLKLRGSGVKRSVRKRMAEPTVWGDAERKKTRLVVAADGGRRRHRRRSGGGWRGRGRH